MQGGATRQDSKAEKEKKVDVAELPPPSSDATAFARAATARHKVSAAMCLVGVGLACSLAVTYMLCTSNLGDEELTKAYHAEVDGMAYQWPMVAFGTAFMLNVMLVAFERGSVKFQLAMVACYINLLAGLNDYLSWKCKVPIMRDAFNQGFMITRVAMWGFTTPTMVYLLSMVSDFTKAKVYRVMAIDFVMILLGGIAQVAPTRSLCIILYILAVACFAVVIYSMWRMFDASLAEARNDGSRLSLLVLRFYTVGLWFTFPIIFLLVKGGFLTLNQEEWAWSVADFLGKVMFSSSLLQGNFLTIEQRRLIAMRIVEEGNRVQVIQELKDLVEQKERFMSGMSHELRTPLNGIIGLSDALVVGSCGQINDAALKTITTIKTSGSRLLNLINDILDAASMRKMHGKLTIKHEKVNLCRIVDDVIELCGPLAKRGVQLVNDVPGNIPCVLGDNGRIIQIFHNLIGNSCKFTHTGFITISATHKVDEVEISVSDTGIGIPEDKFDQIFQAFEQVDMSTTRKYGGTGLGLNLVKQLVEAHNGTISVKSKLGRGTTFYFTIKTWDEPASTDGRTSNSAAPPEPPPSSTMLRRPSVDSQGFPAPTATRASNPTHQRAVQRNSSFRTASRLATRVPSTDGVVPDANGTGIPALVAAAAAAAAAASTPGSPKPRVTPPGQYDATNVSGPVPLKDALTLATRVMRRPSLMARVAANADKPAADKGAVSGQPPSPPPKIKVLSVDDDPVNQMVVQNLLTPEGYQIIQAMDGQEALDILAADSVLPDVILLDVMMPGMSGYEVCRKLRELYPLSCIPVIMISAKSKEEHIVEGLAAGSNDYVVKPFGRQEILARISAHLRFRDSVYQAGEMAGSTDCIKLHGDTPTDLDPFLDVSGRGMSLPLTISAEIDAGRGTSLKVYEQLTLVMLSVANLEELSVVIAVDDLTAALSSMHIYLDDLLEHHNAYMVDDVLQGVLVVVTGLRQEVDQVDNALQFVRGALAAVDNIQLAGENQLQLAVAVHSMPAQGVVVGVEHPVMHLTGELPAATARLLAACPAGCVHVSSRVAASLQGDKAQLVRAASMRGEPTYLLQAGRWADELSTVAARCEKFRSAHLAPSVNTSSERLKPVQRALMHLVRLNPALILELWNAAVAATSGVISPQNHYALPPPTEAPQAAAGAAPPPCITTLQQQLSKLSHDKEVLTRQLDEVSQEAGRLQDQVDELQLQLAAAESAVSAAKAAAAAEQQATAAAIAAKVTAEATAAQALAAAKEAEGKVPAAKLAELEAALAQAQAKEAGLEAALAQAQAKEVACQQSLAETERKLAATQAALVSTHEQQALLVAGVRAEAEAVLQKAQGARPGTVPPLSLHASSTLKTQPSSHHGPIPTGHAYHKAQGHWLPNPHYRPPTGERGLAPGGEGCGGEEEYRAGQLLTSSLMGVTDREMECMSLADSMLQQAMRGGGSRSSSMQGTAGRQPLLSPAATQDIRVLLEELGLTELTQRFLEEEVTPSLLPYLDEDVLREMGVTSMGARLKLKLAAQSLVM
ncbi:chlamyopsin-5 [Haematococcus lacustris]